MIAPCRLFSHMSAFVAQQPVYRYRVNLTQPDTPAMIGATHGIELAYVWNSPNLQLNATYSRTVHFVSRAWISFISDLDPNDHGMEGIPRWNPYSIIPSGENFVIALNNFSTEPDTYRLDGINFINSAILEE